METLSWDARDTVLQQMLLWELEMWKELGPGFYFWKALQERQVRAKARGNTQESYFCHETIMVDSPSSSVQAALSLDESLPSWHFDFTLLRPQAENNL